MKNKIVLFFLLTCMARLTIYAQTLEHQLEKPSQIYVGTPFKLNLSFKTGLKDTIYSTQLDTLDIFILRQENQSEIVEDNRKITNLELTFQAFDTGEHTFPSLEFSVKSQDKISTLSTSEFIINVRSAITDSSNVIKDISEPLALKLGFWDILIPVLVIILFVLVVIQLRRLIAKKDKLVEQEKLRDDRPAYVIALELLVELKKKNFLAQGDFLNFYFELSFILRLFFELQFKIRAVEMTTSEIRRNLHFKDFKEKSTILSFLQEADKIKFAKHIPDLDTAETAYKWLEDYLKSYKSNSYDSNDNSEKENV